MSNERDAVLLAGTIHEELQKCRTQLADVTRERDSWRSQRDEVHAEMERQTQLKREERQAKLDAMRERDALVEDMARAENSYIDVGLADMRLKDAQRRVIATLTRERDEARADREWLALQLDAAKETIQYGIGLRQKAEADAARLREALMQVRDAMLATGQEPDGDDDPRRPVATVVWRVLTSTPSAEPTPRDMRVAEAVRDALVEMADASDEVSRRVAGDLRSIDLAAVVAKAVKP